MRILFDFEIMINQRIGGVSRYFSEIIARMQKYPDTKIEMFALFPRSKDLCSVFNRKLIFNYPYGALRLLYPLNDFFIKPILHGKYSIIHQTQYKLVIPAQIHAKVVVTVHDMIFEMFPEIDPSGKWKLQKYRAMMRADKIIAISHTTKRDIMRIYPNIPDEKIRVIYHGVTDYSKKYLNIVKGIPSKYILFVGERRGYKNFTMFIKAMAKLLIKDSTLYVVCTGNSTFTSEENELMERLGIVEQVIRHNCTDFELAFLYQNALCFVFPSLYEGFGLPILEAYSAGCPTVISDTDIFHEIAGDASCYIDPKDMDDIRQKVEKIIQSETYRMELINRGRERIKAFSWNQCAEQTYQVYQELLL